MEWLDQLDHYRQRFLAAHALRGHVSMQVGKTGSRLLETGHSETCLSDLKRAVDGTQFLDWKNSEKVGLLLWAEPHTKLSGSFQVLLVHSLGMSVNNIPRFMELFAPHCD
jgi:hypothetical protein